MKTTSCLAICRLSILAILFLLSTGVLIAQVRIKERVEIAPKATTSYSIANDDENEFTQSFQLNYPAEVTGWNLGYYASMDHTTISPGWEECGTLPGYTVMHLYWIVSCNGRIVRCNDSQCPYDCEPFEYADYGGTFGIFPKGELRFFPYGMDADGALKIGSTPYYLGADPWLGHAGDCGGTLGLFQYYDSSYHQIPQFSINITRLNFCPPVAITFFDNVSSVMYMDAKELKIGLQDACGKNTTGFGPTPVKYYVKITNGKEWGYLYNQTTGQYGDSIKCSASDCDTSFTFLAMNQQPNEDQQVMLRVWSNDSSFIPATREITVQSAKCMLLSVAKSQIRPGERDSISMMQNLGDGTLRPYPVYQKFSIRLDTSGGKWYGTLLCLATGDTGQVLNGLPQPFEFIAADSNCIDFSVDVEIEANAQIVQGVACSIDIGKDTLRSHTSIMASTETKVRNITPVPNEISGKNIEASIKKLQSLLDRGIAKKDNEKQRLAYGIKKLKAQLAAYKTAKNPTKKQSSSVNLKQTSLSFLGTTGCTGKNTVTINNFKILLGQTKYYYAIADPNDPNNLIINETTIEPPALGSGGLSSATFDDAVAASGSEKNPVYWEKKDTTGAPLPNGMIRLVGRYWEQGKTFKSTLTAHADGKSATIDIEVKKPAKLYDINSSSPWYNEAWGIRDNRIDIDSLCILYGGIIGIPPQIIKGQMFQESYKEGGNFWPSYRYEPWQDYKFLNKNTQEKSDKYMKQPFWVTGESQNPMGAGKIIPVNHRNVNDINPPPYPTQPISIADYTINNWRSKYWNSKELRVVGSDELSKMWRRRWLGFFIPSLIFTQSPPVIVDPYGMATQAVQDFIKTTYTDYAQTRKAASYGFIQMLYTTALDQGYNAGESISSSLAPEELNNELIEMPLYKKFTEKNLRSVFNGYIPDSQWPDGWEKTWMNSFTKYNSKSDYPSSVFNNAKKFFPQSK